MHQGQALCVWVLLARISGWGCKLITKSRLASDPFSKHFEFEMFQSKATDFLDHLDDETGTFYFAGVLDRHYGPNDATYFRVKEMIPWIEKYVPGKFLQKSLQLWNDYLCDSRLK